MSDAKFLLEEVPNFSVLVFATRKGFYQARCTAMDRTAMSIVVDRPQDAAASSVVRWMLGLYLEEETSSEAKLD